MSANLIVCCAAAFVLILTPGPNFFYVLTRGAAQGRRAGVVAACGLGAGVLVHTTLAGSVCRIQPLRATNQCSEGLTYIVRRMR